MNTVNPPNLPSLPVALEKLAERIRQIPSATKWQRVVQPVANETLLLAWLAGGEGVRLYWSCRESELEFAAQDVALRMVINTPADLVECQQQLHAIFKDDPQISFYGGMAFSDDANDHWPGFAGGELLLPRYELINENGYLLLVCNLYYDGSHTSEKEREQILARLPTLLPYPYFPRKMPTAGVVDNTPNWEQWQQSTHSALAAIAEGRVDKVVLAREQTLQLHDTLCPWSMLWYWQQQTPHTYRYGYTNSAGETFYGASPERLYRRHGSKVMSEALAGTTPRGDSLSEDEQLASALLNDDKNRHENALVLRAIYDVLSQCGQQVDPSADMELVKLSRIQHLRQRITATINEDVTDAQLLSLLHPTPAVGGLPQRESIRLISELEHFPRGWYAGPFGMIGEDRAEFAVAIRCARVLDKTLKLYSGAGIVPGSDIAAEWRELDSKLWTVQSILGVVQ